MPRDEEKGSKGRRAESSTKDKGDEKPKKKDDELTDKERKEQIEMLLDDLRENDDPGDKRKIRAKLRRLGHSGGLGEGRGRKAKDKDDEGDEDEAPAPKKSSRRRAAADDDE